MPAPEMFISDICCHFFLIRPNGNGVLLHTSVIGKIGKNHIRVIVDDVGNFGETLSCNIVFRDEVNKDVMHS